MTHAPLDYAPLSHAWEVTEEDIEDVLRENSLLVVDSGGATFAAMAAGILYTLDCGRVSAAAVAGGDDMESQTEASHREIRAILVETGVLKR